MHTASIATPDSTLPVNMLHDAIIVLGYNNNPEDPLFQARVARAVALYEAGQTQQLIMSGCCSMQLDIRPQLSEAAAMADYAIELGVPASAILLEEESVDTLGNFYFSKTQFLLPCSWYDVGFVSTPWHVYRSQWLAAKVLGEDFNVTGYPSDQPRGWQDDDIKRSELRNRELLAEAQSLLGGIRAGDHEAVRPYLGTRPNARHEGQTD